MKAPDSFVTLHAAGRFDYWAGAKHGDLDQATREKLFRLWLQHGAYWDPQYDGEDREGTLAAWASIIAPVLDAQHRAMLEELAKDSAAPALKSALDAFVATLPERPLRAVLPPTRYNPKFLKGDRARRLYDESVAFFQTLVAEGHTKFQAQLEETRANRDAALAG